jgi:hypothetical protein
MNEIILAPCDAGYVQSCTGFIFGPLTFFITFLFFPDNFEVIKSVYFLQNVKKT